MYIVIGTSAGGITPLIQILKLLPKRFPASLFVVVHTSPESPGNLPLVLRRSSELEVTFPRDTEETQPGYVYIAPPNRHMLLENGNVLLNHTPRENGFRPSIDPLFRSAAAAHENQVIGIVLSGNLGDGT